MTLLLNGFDMLMMPARRPEGVVVTKDGQDIICELTYRGVQDDEGRRAHIWSTPTTFEPHKGDSIKIGVLPVQTGIQFGESDD